MLPRLLVLASAAALPALGLLAGPASALPNPCPASAHHTTCTFSFASGTVSWPVPYGVTSLTVVADGASGGSTTDGTGGLGGEYRARISGLPVSGGEDLTVSAGGQGGNSAGGANGGGAGTTDTGPGTSGGGGGASFVKDASSTILIEAGGGGGGGAETPAPYTSADGGNGGGSAATSGSSGVGGPAAGGGGSVSTGGTAGTNTSCTTAATAGASQQGGASARGGGSCAFAGGGGGGGYFGGGGAGNSTSGAAGGGGGSAYPAAASTIDGLQVTPESDSGRNTGNGQVVISFRNVRTALSPSLSFNAGQTDTLHAILTAGPHGHPVAGEPVDFSTGTTALCTGVITNSRGHAHCVLTASQTLDVELHDGTFKVSFAGGVGLTPAEAIGVSSWFPWS